MRILIVGLGSIAKKHITAINEEIPSAEIYALRSKKKAERFPGVINIVSVDQLNDKIDFAIISNPTQLHSQAILTVLALNCPLFIEKPVLDSLHYAEQLARLIKEKKILTYVACNLRFHPVLQFIKEYILTKKPRINEVNIYCGSYLPRWRPGVDFRKVYSSQKEMGGGVHLDLIHELDYACWIFGQPSEVKSLKRNVSSININATDFAQFNFFYPQFLVNISLNYYRTEPKREMEILTDEETIMVDLISSKVYVKATGDILFDTPFSMNDTYQAQIRYFLNNISKTETMNTFSNGVDVLKLALHE